jgi:hypothetical protein
MKNACEAGNEVNGMLHRGLVAMASDIGTKRTQLDVQRESAMRSRADIELDHAEL